MIARNDDWRSLSWKEMAREIKEADSWDEVQEIVEYVNEFFELGIDFEATDWEDRVYAWCDQQLTEGKRGEKTMKAEEMFTGNSFGWNCPENFQEICDALNSIAEEELGDEENDDIRREIINSVWERFCSGELEGVPEGRNYNDDETVTDENGDPVDYEAAVRLMDDELREKLQMKMAPCSRQEFFEAYAEAHREKFNENFAPAVGGAW